MAAARPVLAKLADVGVPTVVYGPPVVVDRATVYPVAPATALQVRSISDVDTAEATTPVGWPSNVVAVTSLEVVEPPDPSLALTT